MKILLSGAGSIGQRHLRNLISLGIDKISVIEPDREKANLIKDRFEQVDVYEDFQSGLNIDPDVVFITSPNHLHVSQALSAAEADCHLFIEKPLSNKTSQLQELADLIKRKQLISMVACNMRFHPGIVKAYQWYEEGLIGEVYFSRFQVGSNLREWHPNDDYRKSYSALRSQGGGCILDCIHEIDLGIWFMGKVIEVTGIAERVSDLEIETEDLGILINKHENGSISEIQMDYLQRTYERNLQLTGNQGSIFWDYERGITRYYNAASDEWTEYSEPDNWDYNEMYLNEIKHFLDCVKKHEETVLPVEKAIHVTRVALAALESGERGKRIKL